jgi:hypothetical protein
MPANTPTERIDTSNVTFIEWGDAQTKVKLPPGPWQSEPDFVSWEINNLRCVMIRDEDLGSWKGFVGLPSTHLLYNKTLKDIVEEKLYIYLPKVHGGITYAGQRSPADKWKELNKTFWFIGFETIQENDLIPVLYQPLPTSKGGKVIMSSKPKYRSLKYVKTETTRLAKNLYNIKK